MKKLFLFCALALVFSLLSAQSPYFKSGDDSIAWRANLVRGGFIEDSMYNAGFKEGAQSFIPELKVAPSVFSLRVFKTPRITEGYGQASFLSVSHGPNAGFVLGLRDIRSFKNLWSISLKGLNRPFLFEPMVGGDFLSISSQLTRLEDAEAGGILRAGGRFTFHFSKEIETKIGGSFGIKCGSFVGRNGGSPVRWGIEQKIFGEITIPQDFLKGITIAGDFDHFPGVWASRLSIQSNGKLSIGLETDFGWEKSLGHYMTIAGSIGWPSLFMEGMRMRLFAGSGIGDSHGQDFFFGIRVGGK